MNTRLCVKELAASAGVNPSYIYAMRKAGFVMAGGKASLEQYDEWLRLHPSFRQRNAWRKKKGVGT